MPSDVKVNSSALVGRPTPKASELARYLMKEQDSTPKWWEVGAAEFRRMRDAGETQWPKPVVLPEYKDETVPSRDAGRTIPVRVVHPADATGAPQPPRGIYMHIHGGGWTLGNERSQDLFLRELANRTGLLVVSVGYRLAPEHPFPAGPNDCYDAAEYLVDQAQERFGVELLFLGGESAGGHMSSLVVLHLLQSRPGFKFKGVVLNYGAYNLAIWFSTATNFKLNLTLPREDITKFLESFLPPPYHTLEARADPSISPFYAPLFRIDDETLETSGVEGLPPALFVCGTLDPLLEDTILMAARWSLGGTETETRIYKGLPHGFNLIPEEYLPESRECMEMECSWIRQHM